MKQIALLEDFLNIFLTNYQNEGKILRNGSNFVFESVNILYYNIHNIKLKRGKSYIKSPE